MSRLNGHLEIGKVPKMFILTIIGHNTQWAKSQISFRKFLNNFNIHTNVNYREIPNTFLSKIKSQFTLHWAPSTAICTCEIFVNSCLEIMSQRKFRVFQSRTRSWTVGYLQTVAVFTQVHFQIHMKMGYYSNSDATVWPGQNNSRSWASTTDKYYMKLPRNLHSSRLSPKELGFLGWLIGLY